VRESSKVKRLIGEVKSKRAIKYIAPRKIAHRNLFCALKIADTMW